MDFDFSIILVSAVAIAGGIYLLDILLLKKLREARAEKYKQTVGVANVDQAVMDKKLKEPAWVEIPKSFFSVLLIVLILRSFLFEPFKIPSGSMIPTLEVGDYIAVNKFSYGLRLPIVGTEIVPIGEPQRGDIMVFRYPLKKTMNFIKRVVGLPGDTVTYENNSLYINGNKVDTEFVAQMPPQQPVIRILDETLGEHTHKIHIDTRRPAAPANTWVVPQGHYFVMGDNRDYSSDSRVWGFVPENHIVGKAVAVWMHMPGWVPSFSRNRLLYNDE